MTKVCIWELGIPAERGFLHLFKSIGESIIMGNDYSETVYEKYFIKEEKNNIDPIRINSFLVNFIRLGVISIIHFPIKLGVHQLNLKSYSIVLFSIWNKILSAKNIYETFIKYFKMKF